MVAAPSSMTLRRTRSWSPDAAALAAGVGRCTTPSPVEPSGASASSRGSLPETRSISGPRLLHAQPVDAHRRGPRVVEPGDLRMGGREEPCFTVGHGQIGNRCGPARGEGQRFHRCAHREPGARLAGDLAAQRQVGARGRDVDAVESHVEIEARGGRPELPLGTHGPASRHGSSQSHGRRTARGPGEIARAEPDPGHLEAGGRAHRGVGQGGRSVFEHALADRQVQARHGRSAFRLMTVRRARSLPAPRPVGAVRSARRGSVPSRRRSTMARGFWTRSRSIATFAGHV